MGYFPTSHSQGNITAFFTAPQPELTDLPIALAHLGREGMPRSAGEQDCSALCLPERCSSMLSHSSRVGIKKVGVILHIPSFTAGLCLFLRTIPFMSMLEFRLLQSRLSSPLSTYAFQEKNISKVVVVLRKSERPN